MNEAEITLRLTPVGWEASTMLHLNGNRYSGAAWASEGPGWALIKLGSYLQQIIYAQESKR